MNPAIDDAGSRALARAAGRRAAGDGHPERFSPWRQPGGGGRRRGGAGAQSLYRRIRGARPAGLCHARLASGGALLVSRAGRAVAGPLRGGHARRGVRGGARAAARHHGDLQGDLAGSGGLFQLSGHRSGQPPARSRHSPAVHRRAGHRLLRAQHGAGCAPTRLRGVRADRRDPRGGRPARRRAARRGGNDESRRATHHAGRPALHESRRPASC